jgi:hypothetical protein
MGVSAEHQIDVSPGSSPQNNWVMRKQEFHFILARTGEREWNVLKANHSVVDACQPERSAIEFEAHTLVDQYVNSLGPEEVRYQVGVCPMIMISEDSENAVASF